MFSSRRSRVSHALSTFALIAVIVIVIIIIAVGAYAAVTFTKPNVPTSSITTTTPASTSTHATTTGTTTSTTTINSSTTTTVSATTSTSTTNTSVPSTFVYETAATPSYLDPQVSYFAYDYNILQNVYEPLLWYNGTSSTSVIPWLAQNYTLSSDGRTVNFTLRQGIKFGDGEPLNSTAVYFSLNRLLIDDSSSPTSHGTQASWIVQQLLNTALSGVLGAGHQYDGAWANQTLAQNFVQVTGPLTFTLHIQVPNAAFPYLISGVWADIVAPSYVMSHDISTWSSSDLGYSLPFPVLGGNLTQQISEYFMDQVSTCNAGATPRGCGTTYLDGSYNGSLAGTGPYELASVIPTTSDIVFTANPNYWGGPYQYMGGDKIVPQIKTVRFNFVPQQTTRTLDLRSAAGSGRAMAVDVTGDQLYSVADRNQWLSNNTLKSFINGVTLYGPYTAFSTLFDPFGTNVTDAQTGLEYTFQPFADVRWREAFADSVNMTEMNVDINNKLGQVAINAISPELPPAGSFMENDSPAYSYSPSKAAELLLQAMQNPIAQFTLPNGSAAPQGMFNNSFGCNPLPSSGFCRNPITRTINMYYPTGDTVDQAIFSQMAGTINNISSTYNLGLTVGAVPVPAGQFVTLALTGIYYMYSLGWIADYPWVVDFTNAMYVPGGAYASANSMNFTTLSELGAQSRLASESDNITGLLSIVHAMNQFANREVMYLWTIYPYSFLAMTSNVRGFYYNPSLSTSAGGIAGPEYLAALY